MEPTGTGTLALASKYPICADLPITEPTCLVVAGRLVGPGPPGVGVGVGVVERR
jgi:hypothetical protein